MTVGELIDKLKNEDPNLLVVTDGHCDGFSEDVRVAVVYLTRDGHGEQGLSSLWGQHARPYMDATKRQKGWNMTAVLVGEGAHIEAGW